MKILYIAPNEEPQVKEIKQSLEAMQEEVGGYIETVHPFEEDDIVLVCNEEGRLNSKLPNRIAHFPFLKDYIFGPFFFCGEETDKDGDRSMCSLSEAQIETLLTEIDTGTAIPFAWEVRTK